MPMKSRACAHYQYILRLNPIFVPSMQYVKAPNLNRYQKARRSYKKELKETRKKYLADVIHQKKVADAINLRLWNEWQEEIKQNKLLRTEGKEERMEKHRLMVEKARKVKQKKLLQGTENRKKIEKKKEKEMQPIIKKLLEERKFWYTDENMVTEDIFMEEREIKNEPVGWWVKVKHTSHVVWPNIIKQRKVLDHVGLGDMEHLQDLGLNLPQGLSTDIVDDADWQSDSDDEFALLDPIRTPIRKPRFSRDKPRPKSIYNTK